MGIQCPGDEPPCHLAGLVALTAKLIDELALTRATVDGFSDCRDLPFDAVKALARLEEVARENHERNAAGSRWYRWQHRKGPTNMAVEFHLRAPDRYAVEGFAPYSIHAELHDGSGLVEVVLHDSGTSVSIFHGYRSPRGARRPCPRQGAGNLRGDLMAARMRPAGPLVSCASALSKVVLVVHSASNASRCPRAARRNDRSSRASSPFWLRSMAPSGARTALRVQVATETTC